jgi:3-methyladenine DNA glycosylase/8-oxoguanine DNA glycosylase
LILRATDFRPGSLPVHVEGIDRLTPAQEDSIRRALSRGLEIDRDLSGFYALVREYPRYAWIAELGTGRLLASPTVWEDLAKTLLTTNTTWKLTIQMVTRLNALGDPYPDGGHAFPSPSRIAALTVAELDQAVRAGYRSAYLHLLAERIASGEIEVESWRDADLPSEEVYQRIKGLKGFGDYAAGNMLRLLGHFDRLATDSECRVVFREINGGVDGDDRAIRAYYEPFGQWRGLVQWMDVMRSYFVNGGYTGEG